MTARSFTDTWTWDEEPELFEDGTPTGNVQMRIVTAASPDGYVINVLSDASDLQRALTVQALWDAQGRPTS